ncbi:MAG: hypothetical protein GY803_30100 [Chloroflexi bacterium]|nr:hypothetical protein [Chloroflexota bacterium]
MADYSRDPYDRASDSRAKHYFGVRMQQGVPILDADWNEQDDLRRLELEDVGKWVLGNGVPVGSPGFRIASLIGGGVGTIILNSNMAAVGLSSITVDLASSTAADALGFDDTNFTVERFGSSPAQITGKKVEPFGITDGQTLVVQTDNLPPETVTFATADFADPTSPMAAEVAAAISAGMTNLSAEAGAGNDFNIKGGDGTLANAGRILVDGQMVFNESDIRYTEQPLYENVELASMWDVDPVDALATPAANESYLAYLDIWNREVNSIEDTALVDMNIGLETTVRLRREWAVRVVVEADYPTVLASKPDGHSYYVLARLERIAGMPGIDDEMILDERETDASLRREISYYGLDDSVLVNSGDFRDMLIENRDNVRDFILFLTTQFVTPESAYLAAEVMGIDTLSAVAGIADHGIALLDAKSMDTRGAYAFFDQLLQAETRFVTVWKDVVLPLSKGGVQVYNTAFEEMIRRIEEYLTGPAPGGFMTVTESLDRQNLWEALRAQEAVNSEFGEEIGRPTGFLTLTYLGSIVPAIVGNSSFDLRYRISGSVTPDDDIDVEVFIGSLWQATVRNSDGSLPFDLHFGPGEDSAEIVVSVLPPNLPSAETQISLLINARRNSSGLQHISTQKTLRIGDPPPPSEEDYSITIESTNLAQVGGVFQVPTSMPLATVNLNFANNTATPITVDLEFEPETDPLWGIIPGAFGLDDQDIPALDNQEYSFAFTPPASSGNTLIFIFRGRDAATSNVVAEIQITLTTV